MNAIDTNVKVIVLSGGPCAGKTTCLARINELLQERGFNVFVVPEAASLAILGGIPNLRDKPNVHVDFQLSLLQIQLQLEQTFITAACKTSLRNNRPSVVICDRGTMDGKGFTTAEEWTAVLMLAGTNEILLRDKRYDAVIFLESAAVNASQCYSCDSNKARKETAEQASIFDRKLKEAWQGHEHFRFVPSMVNFADKMKLLDKTVTQLLGIPQQMEHERRWRIPALSDEQIHVLSDGPITKAEISQTYLLSTKNDQVERVRARRIEGTTLYTHTIKKGVGLSRVEEERRIAADEYLTLMQRADPSCATIIKTRTSFLHQGKVYEHDVYSPEIAAKIEKAGLMKPGEAILEIELHSPDEQVNPDVPIIEEITTKSDYSNAYLAWKIG